MTDIEDIDLPDPDRPDATAEERADQIIGRLLLDGDPVRRYRTTRILTDGSALRDVAAITLRQLREQHGTTEAAAAAVGISRQAANELLAKAGAPGSREEAARRTSYGYRWGQYLAAVEAIAEAADSLDPPRIVNHWEKIRARMVTTTMLPKVTTLTTLWIGRIRNAPARRARRNALDESLAALEGWDAMRSPRHLTVREQADALLGYHQQRRQWRDERRERAAERESA